MKEQIIAAIGRCNPDEPLLPGDTRWCDFDNVRGFELHKTIDLYLKSDEIQNQFSHIILAGHRGSGKSTELNRVIQIVSQEGYLPLYAMVNKEADPNEVSFGDVILLMLRLLESAFSDPKLGLKPLPDKTVQEVTGWFKEVTNIEEQEIERSLEYKGEVGLGVDTPLAKLLFGLKALRKSTGTRRQEIKEAVEKFPDRLRENVNLLLDDAKEITKKKFPNGMIFILDNLDRYDSEMVSQTVIRHAELFKGIQAHTLFVVPISLLYEPKGESIGERYGECETLPMLPVFHCDSPRTPDPQTLNILSGAIFKRVEPELFVDKSVAEKIAQLSGGCPRDMMKLLKQALMFSDKQINEQAVRKAANKVRGEMERLLNLEHYEVLARVYLDTRINSDATGRFLLYYRMALEYNNKRWIGVHPLLWETRELKLAIENERKSRSMLLPE